MVESLVKVADRESSDEELFSLFNPLVSSWFRKKFSSFSAPQKRALSLIHSRENTLVSAPTGSGKTLTAFLSILNELVDSSLKEALKESLVCVYVSPLKALNNDVEVNLLRPLRELEELHGTSLGIRVAVRTGDTSASERSKMLKSPPHILITTPESLALLLSSEKFRSHLVGVQWCIVDEVHALAENKRGVHLSLSLERLQVLNPGMVRVGLSATVAPLEDVAKFLVGVGRACNLVDVQYLKGADFGVVSPVRDLAVVEHSLLHQGLYSLLHELVDTHRTTLIFTNTRAATERVVDYLKFKYPKSYSENIGAHHGSLSKEHRKNLEERLRDGKLKVVVSSTSLELGIDIGYVDLVVCLGSPKSVARFLQRAGRSGHRLHDTIKARVIVLDRDDLVECSVLVKNALHRQIDKIHIPKNCLDVLAQQIIGMVLERDWSEDELFDTVRKSFCYESLSRQDFSGILQYLSGEFTVLEDRHIYARLFRDQQSGMLRRRGRLTRVLYMTNSGTIPDESKVIVKVGSQTIGFIDESFLERLRPGDVFLLGGATYQFRFSRGLVAQVSASANRPPTVPSWSSEQLPLSFDLSLSIGALRRELQQRFGARESNDAIVSIVAEFLLVGKIVAGSVVEYAFEQFEYCGVLPHHEHIVIEFVSGERRTIFHSLYGRRVNDCLSRAVAFVLSRKYKKDVELSMNDNGFSIVGVSREQAFEAFKLLRSDKLSLVLENAIDQSEVFRRRFRHCAGRAFMILRNYLGRQKRVGRQQVSSTILLSALRRISNDFTILKEARREVLEDLMDIENTRKVLEWVESGRVKVSSIETPLPSPFASCIAYQGVLDTMKFEDRHEFLKRMHEYVLARIAQKKSFLVPKSVPQKAFEYEEFWKSSEVSESKDL